MQLDSSIIPSESQHPQPGEAFTYMNTEQFKAAEDGDIEPFNRYERGGLRFLVDGRKNTALHIYSKTGGRETVKADTRFIRFPERRFEKESISIHFMEQLVHKCPSLLLRQNDNGEIPFHIAVQYEHHKIVEFLIKVAKQVTLPHEDLENGTSEVTGGWLREMLRKKDKEENTAFHMAVGRRGSIDLVRLLGKELDPDFSFSSNKRGETPLYIAARISGNDEVVAWILNHCKSTDYGGPNGTTALHAAVMGAADEDVMKKLTDAEKELTKKTDDEGRTPLHYAAYIGWCPAVDQLLKADASAAYITDKERGMSALHMAALLGHRDIMEAIISHCPGCCEIVDKNGWNFLHLAVATLSNKELRRFLRGIRNKIRDLTVTSLLHERDPNGNTPFNMRFSCPPDKISQPDLCLWDYYYLRFPDFELWHSETKKKQIQEALNDTVKKVEVAGIPVEEVGLHDLRKKMQKEENEEKEISEYNILEKGREAHLIVVTLVATVTFAAALTLPGGFRGDKGTAILSGDEAFKAFIITDTVAFVSSLLAIFVHFLYPSLMKRDRYLLVRWLRLADWLTFLAMVAMVVAFSTGTYAVLKPTIEFAVATCSLGLVFFPGLILASYLIFTY